MENPLDAKILKIKMRSEVFGINSENHKVIDDNRINFLIGLGFSIGISTIIYAGIGTLIWFLVI
jgi:hypothetical protein